jgi:hypothetical protein
VPHRTRTVRMKPRAGRDEQSSIGPRVLYELLSTERGRLEHRNNICEFSAAIRGFTVNEHARSTSPVDHHCEKEL